MYAIDKKTGKRIVGTLEIVTGRAEIGSWSRGQNGELEFEYAGGTEIFWDEQKTVERDGQAVYLTEEGDEVLERDIELVEEDEDKGQADPAEIAWKQRAEADQH